MRKNKGETDQGRPSNSPLIKAKNRFLLVFRLTWFRLMGASLILMKTLPADGPSMEIIHESVSYPGFLIYRMNRLFSNVNISIPPLFFLHR
jgi:hypothetical protein